MQSGESGRFGEPSIFFAILIMYMYMLMLIFIPLCNKGKSNNNANSQMETRAAASTDHHARENKNRELGRQSKIIKDRNKNQKY